MEGEESLDVYLRHLKEIRRMSDGRLNKNRGWLERIQRELSCPILNTFQGSKINDAILRVVAGRKKVYNGGVIDDGANMKFCLAQAVVCFMRWAHAEGLIQRNPYPMNPFPERPEHPPNHLNDPEKLQKIFSADVDLELRLAISILIDTGMRIGEMVKLRVCEFDWQKKTFSVYMTKVDRPKCPVVTDRTVALMEAWLIERTHKDPTWIFPGLRRGHKTTEHFRYEFRKIGERLGFRMNPHSFRHTTTSLWLENGANETDVMTQIGIKDRKTLMRYAHLSHGHLHSVQERVLSKVKIMRPEIPI